MYHGKSELVKHNQKKAYSYQAFGSMAGEVVN
jgi:hypothetical protein